MATMVDPEQSTRGYCAASECAVATTARPIQGKTIQGPGSLSEVCSPDAGYDTSPKPVDERLARDVKRAFRRRSDSGG